MSESILDEIQIHYQAARAAIGQYRLAEARSQLEAARELIATVSPDTVDTVRVLELEVRIALSQSWLISDAGGLTAALEQVAAARMRAETADRDDLCALAHIQAGVLCARAGLIEEALGHLHLALPLSTGLPVDDRVRFLLNKGTIASQMGRYAEAATDLAAAARLADGLPQFAFMAMHNLGFIEYLRGDLPAALQAMLTADDMDAEVDRSVSRLDRARVLMEVGLVDDAAQLLGITITDMREAGMAEELADALLDEARCALLRGRQDEAVTIADEVLAMAREPHYQHRALAAAGVRLEALLASSSDEQQRSEAMSLEADADRAGMQGLADRAVALGIIAGAQQSSPVKAARLGRLRRSPYLAVRLLAIRAQLTTTDDPDRVSRLLRTAAHHLAVAKAGMASLDLRTALTLHVWPIIIFDLQRALRSGRPWQVLLATERWRGALHTVPSVKPSANTVTAELWSKLRQSHEAMRDPAGTDPAVHSDAVRIERQLREHSWAMAGDAARLSRAVLRRSDLNEATVLNYFWLEGRLHLVAVEPGRSARIHRLGDRELIDEYVARVAADASALARLPQGPLAAGIRSSLETCLAKLDPLVLPPMTSDGPVMIVPSEALARLPWGMLPRLRKRSITLSRSVSSWLSGRTMPSRPPRVAACGGPDLALADEEARRVGQAWPAGVVLEPTVGSVRDALTRYEVVHIAAHGQHRMDNPLFSSLQLADGALFAHELEQLPLRSSLVVLSACGAGRARLRQGDEALGLTASLLALGVNAVVAPLTDVPDAVAYETMVGLHQGLAAGMDGATALAAASPDLLARSFTWFGSPWRTG